MAKWAPCKRKNFIRKLKKLGFESPEPGGRHFYMRYESFTFTVPNNPEYSFPHVRMLVRELELGMKKRISLEEWSAL